MTKYNASTTLIKTPADVPFLESQSQVIINSGTTPEISPATTSSVQNNFLAKKDKQGPRDIAGEPTQYSSVQKPVEETPKYHESKVTSDHQMRPKHSARQRTNRQ